LLCRPILDGEILSLNSSKLAQLLPERLHQDRATRGIAWIQEAYTGDFPCLLRLGADVQSAKSMAQSARVMMPFFMNFPHPNPPPKGKGMRGLTKITSLKARTSRIWYPTLFGWEKRKRLAYSTTGHRLSSLIRRRAVQTVQAVQPVQIVARI
jgi:hypothetical protein